MSTLTAYALSFGATLVAAVAGSAASIQSGAFYGALDKPSWAPPPGVFGPVWTLLYLMMALAGGMALSARAGKAPGLAVLFLLQLAANGLWSWTFFRWESGLASMITIAVLWIAILATTVGFWRANSVSGALMLPYLAWVTFAAVLNGTIWGMNPGVL